MKLFFAAAALLIVLATGALGQDENEVVKIATNLIQVDVSVTDKKGRVVGDLKSNDFEIFQNGERQSLSNFRFVSRARSAAPAELSETKRRPIPSTPVRSGQIRRTLAIIVDDLMLSFESAHRTQRAVRKFVDEQVQPGDLVAIIRTGGNIGALQQFTTDKQRLYAAVDRIKWNPNGTGGLGAFAPIEATPAEIRKASGDSTVKDEDIEAEKRSAKSRDDFRDTTIANGSLGAIKYIVGGMRDLPGRKSIILFSDGFPLLSRNEIGATDGGSILEFAKSIVDLANRAAIVFYTIDARGLQTTGITAQDKILNPSPQRFQAILSSRRAQLLELQDGLRFLAKETGGFALVDSNDLDGGIGKILDDQSYYLIGYEPDQGTFDPAERRYNRFEIRVKRPGVTVRYRSGFFNVASDQAPGARPVLKRTAEERLREALDHPFASDGLAAKLNLLFANDAANGSHVRALIHLDASGLKFIEQPDHTHRASLEIMTAAFGDNGVPLSSVVRGYTITANEQNYRQILRDGIAYQIVVPTKTPGPYQFRVAVRDPLTDAIGTASEFLEVPDLSSSGHVISGLLINAYSSEQWQKLAAGGDDGSLALDPIVSTTIRKFGPDVVLRYGFEVYNARVDASHKPHLTTKVRVFRDGMVTLDGQIVPIELDRQSDPNRVHGEGVIAFGKGTMPGDYVLEVSVFDELAKGGRRLATRYLPFEITE